MITIFPEIFEGFAKESLLGRAQKKKIISLKLHSLRKWGIGKHETVDDIPYGGGPGMVLKIEPIYKAVRSLKAKSSKQKARVILFSPRGKKFNTKMANRFAKYDQLILVCGRYEGVDERVAKHIADEVVSVGDYILIGGEVAAMAVIEAVSRFIPGVIGKVESVEKWDYAQYTRPEIFQKWKVPAILRSGRHADIEKWRKEHGRDQGEKVVYSVKRRAVAPHGRVLNGAKRKR